jgi:hypothetical protein
MKAQVTFHFLFANSMTFQINEKLLSPGWQRVYSFGWMQPFF